MNNAYPEALLKAASWCGILLLAGCATGYHAKSFAGGYYDYPAGGANRYMVGFKGNGFTNPSLVTQYAHKRASELCAEKGFSGYKVLTQEALSGTSRAPSTSNCTGTSDGSSFNATCTEQPGSVVTKSGRELMIECENQ